MRVRILLHRFVRSYVWCNGNTFSLCFPINGAVVQLVRMPPCHGGDSGVRVPSAPQMRSSSSGEDNVK